MSDEDKIDECKTTKKFDAMLKDIKNFGKTTKPITDKSHGTNIDLHPLIKNINKRRKNSAHKGIWI